MVGILGQEGQKIELLGCKVLFHPVDIDSSGGLVDLQAPDLDDVIGLLSGSHQSLIPGHMGLDPGHQLTGREGLGHVVVRPQAQAPDLVDIVLLGRYHEDGHVSGLPDPSADFKAVHARQHQIQNDQVKLPAHGRLQTLVPSVLDLYLKARQLQVILFQIGDRFFIFNNQYSAHVFSPNILYVFNVELTFSGQKDS